MASVLRVGTRHIAAALAAALVVVLGPALAATGPVALATVSPPTLTWSGPIRLAYDGLGGFLSAVACPTATQCTAGDIFGRVVTFDPAAPASTAPYTLDSGQNILGVVCPSATECVAVTDGGHEVAFNPATPASATPRSIDGTQLRALACPTATQCTAADGTGHELTFDPTTTDAPTNVTVDSGKQLNGLSCPSTTQCTAVDNAGRAVTFDPAAPGSPTPAAINGSTSLNGVSCPTTTQCTATDGSTSGQVVTFDPTNVGTPTPVAIDSTHILTDITCLSASRCVAIDNAHHQLTFDPTSPTPANVVTVGATFSLTGVDCPSTSQCTVVDNGGQTTKFDPAATSSPTMTLISGRHSLPGLSCPSATQCTAIDDSKRVVTLNPTAGSPSTPTLTSITAGSIKGVACPSTSQCTALDSSGSKELTFNPATPATHTSVAMNINAPVAIACPSTTVCVAMDSGGQRSTFNPTSASPLPLLVDFGQTTNALACPSTTQCTTVDNAGQFVTFGPNDSPSTSYFPSTIDSGQRLFGVACPSTAKCVAVDWIGQTVVFSPTAPSGPVVTLIDSGRVFRGVACATTTLCIAVDDRAHVIEGDPAHPSNWITQSLPQAVDAQAVSCLTATECVATDAMGNAFLGLALPVNTSLPSITGTATQGQLLTALDGSWTNNPTSFGYQWEDCDNAGASCAAIAGAVGSTYTLLASDVGHTVRLIVTATASGVGSGSPATSTATAVVLPLPPGNIAAPTISGNPSQGQMLTENAGTWTNNPTGFAYQWSDCDGSGASCTAVDGATASTYVLQASDVGHTVRVAETATNAGGSSAAADSAQTAVVAPPDTAAPVVQFTTKPANPSAVRTPQFAFSATDDSPPVTFTCQLDSGATTACVSPVSLPTLADGLHTFTVTATDAVSNTVPLAYQWRVDGTAPTALLRTPTSLFVVTTTAAVSWSGTDSGSGIGSYQVRYERAAWNSLIGAWTYPSAWQALHVTSMAVSIPVGYTYCFSVRSIDKAGNASAWTAIRCTARPLDDRSGTPSTGWTRGTSSAYYLSTYTQTTGLNRTLTIKGVRLDRIGIVATKCPTCGVVAVYVGTTLVGKISLYSATLARKVVIALPRFSLRLATVTVKVLTSGKLVQLDGLAISKV